jgi:hypothetical protein
VIIAGSASDEEAKQKYPSGCKSPRPYLRIVPSPSSGYREGSQIGTGTNTGSRGRDCSRRNLQARSLISVDGS